MKIEKRKVHTDPLSIRCGRTLVEVDNRCKIVKDKTSSSTSAELLFLLLLLLLLLLLFICNGVVSTEDEERNLSKIEAIESFAQPNTPDCTCKGR